MRVDLDTLRKAHGIRTLADAKRILIHRALIATCGNVQLAAKLLDVPYNTLRQWKEVAAQTKRDLYL